MSAIELARVNLAGQIDELVAQIDKATAEEAKSAYDRMGVAREWAKLQENARELAERLVWLEAVILRRIGQLDPRAIVGPRRPAARHFATLDDATLAALIAEYPARSAVTTYNLWAKAQGIRKSHRRGTDFALGQRDSQVDSDDDIDGSLRYSIEARILSVRQAAAIIIDEYAAYGGGTVAAVVEEFIADETPISETASPLEVSAFRKGLTEAVRHAFATAPVDASVRSWSIPAYITTHDDATDQWLRVPSEFATVGDARKMLALRRGQIESAKRSLIALEESLLGRFSIDHREPDEYLRDDTTALTRRLKKASMTA